MNWYDDVILPKVWFEVIRRWWDVKVPTDYPTETGVEFSLNFGDNKDAVDAMEASLQTDEPVVAPFTPEDTFIQQYVGVFEAEGEGGEQILLSPVQVNTPNVIALHYNADEDKWENIENVNVVDGYVYGDLESLSPIAIFTYKSDIKYIDNLAGLKALVCNGNPTKLFMEEEKLFALNQASGTKIELSKTDRIFVFGGTCDGSDVDTTCVSADGITSNIRIFAGSVGTDDKVPTVGLAKAYVINSKLNGVSGSYYKCRTKKLEITIKDSEVENHIGAGQSMYHGSKNKDGNVLPLSDDSDFVTFESEMYLENVKTLIFYVGSTSGLAYVKKASTVAKNCDFGWACCGSSNGRIDEASLDLSDSKCTVLETANRGEIGSASVVLNRVSSENGIYIAGDSTDTTVDGTVNEVRYDIGKGCSGTLFLGTNGGVELKDNSIVKYVKYSRNAGIDFGKNVKEVLGEKLKMK